MVGIIILNFNSADDTIKCIRSIDEHTSVPYMVFVVDGCSQDNSFERLSSYFTESGNVKILKSDINGGYSYGNNLGAIKAIESGVDAILIVNPDVILINNAIDLLYYALIKEKNLAVVGPRIFNNKNVDMQIATKLYTFNAFLSSKKPLVYFNNKHISKNRYYHFNYRQDFSFQGMVSGCCFMIRSDDFKRIGYLDTNIFLYYEEDILAYKLLKINKFTRIISDAIIVHNHSTIVKKEGSAFIRFHRFLSSQYVLKKYSGINNFQFTFVSIFHVVPFTLKAISDKTYRKLFPDFLKKVRSLYNTEKGF